MIDGSLAPAPDQLHVSRKVNTIIFMQGDCMAQIEQGTGLSKSPKV